MRKLTREVAVAATLGLGMSGFYGGTALAQNSGPTTEQLLRLIQQQQKQLDELKAQLHRAQTTAEKASAQAEQAQEAPSKISISDYLTIGGVLEVEATESEAFSGTNTSDITLAKVEAYIDAQPTDWVFGHVQFIYEDTGSETVSLDEAYARLGDPDEFPLYAQAGKYVVPFGGDFETDMSTDPLTKLIGETKEKAVLVGAAWKGFNIDAYVFNGDTQQRQESNHIDQYGFNVGYSGEIGPGVLTAGVGYIRNFADSDAITDGLSTNARALDSYVPGYEAHAVYSFGGFTLRGAYMTASKRFQSSELAFNGQGAEPAAWVTEAAYTTPFFEKDDTFAVSAQGTREALALGLPERRYGGTITVGVLPHTSLALEYLHDQDYSASEGGTGENGHTATMKLTLEY